MAGSLTIVGMLPAGPGMVTAEAVELLREAAGGGMRVFGLGHVRQLAELIAPELEVQPLDHVYLLKGVHPVLDDLERGTIYRYVAEMLIREAFQKEQEVLYLTEGSPLVLNRPVLLIRGWCAANGRPLRIVHGMSFVELVLEQVMWVGGEGLQVLSAWRVAQGEVTIVPSTPALLCQLGEYSLGPEVLDTEGSVVILEELRERLLAIYPDWHEVSILYSSEFPDFEPLAREVPLAKLARQPVPIYSNLWVPPLDGTASQ